MVKRGKEILYWDKNKIAGLFTQSPTNLEAWLVSISNLIEYKFSGESFLKFKPHDLELYVVDRIIKNGKTKNIDGTLCKFMEFNENTIKDFNELGYLNDEILLILQIGQARKYFNF